MSEKKTPKKKIRTKSHWTAVIFWICLILIATPVCVLGWILLSSSMDTGKPIFGNRYEGNLDPAITEKDLDSVEEAAKDRKSVV